MELDPRIKRYRDSVMSRIRKENNEFGEFMNAYFEKCNEATVSKNNLENLKNQSEYEKDILKKENEKLKNELQNFKNIKSWSDFQSKMDKLVL